MHLLTSCLLEFNPQDYTPFTFMLRPKNNNQQWVLQEEYKLTPQVPVIEFTDNFKNKCQRMMAPPGYFSICTAATIQINDQQENTQNYHLVKIENLPSEVLQFLLPSRYCESDRFNSIALSIVGNCEPGYNQCLEIVNYLQQQLTYIPGSGESNLSAWDLYSKNAGVCRDLAHLGIALCRSLNIPARMAVGYLAGLEPMDMHAWFEAYIGDRWISFDPTQSSHSNARVVIAHGRDAADVAIYNQFYTTVPLERMDISITLLEEY